MIEREIWECKTMSELWCVWSGPRSAAVYQEENDAEHDQPLCPLCGGVLERKHTETTIAGEE